MLCNSDIETAGKHCSCLQAEVECIYNARHERKEQQIMLDTAKNMVSDAEEELSRQLTSTEPKQIEHSPLLASAEGWSFARLCSCWCLALLSTVLVCKADSEM
jgi:hypothetical protein